MATETETNLRRYRRLRKASDLPIVANASSSSSSSKRVRTSKKRSSYEDRISSLPDEILVMILDKLDPRTSITTSILSKRWLDLPRRNHTCYDLAVDDILPARYHRLKRLRMEVKAAYESEKKRLRMEFKEDHESDDNSQKLAYLYAMKDQTDLWMRKIRPLTAILQRYERWAMRCYVKRVNAFLLAPDNAHRTIHKLRLQTYGDRWGDCIDQWFTAAIGRWDVEDLELHVEDLCHFYDFRIYNEWHNARLKRLILFNCHAMFSHNGLIFQKLTKLSLCKMAHAGMASQTLRNFVHLVDLSIRYYNGCMQVFRIDAPTSKLKNLLVYKCNFEKICLVSLPYLETFACRGKPSKLYYGEVPRLRHVSLYYLQTEDDMNDGLSVSNKTYPPTKFFKRIPPIEKLSLQFKGPQVWIEPTAVPSPFSHLKKLFIANVPMNWDIFWILILLDAAPALESCHIHIDKLSEKMSSGLDVRVQHCQYHCLQELVVVGFDGAGWQTGLVRKIMEASPRLRRVHLLDGDILEDDERVLGHLEVIPRRREWHECERSEVLDDLRVGICSQDVEIILE